MKLSIISVNVTSKTSKAGKPFQNAEVIYKNLDSNKVENKNITQYSTVFKAVADAQSGQVFDAKAEKDDAGFWQWTQFVRQTGEAAQAAVANTAAAAPAKGGTWETPEERAKKQTYIIKQSSISSAIAMLTPGAKASLSVEQVVAVAQQLTDFVLGLDQRVDLFEDKNDLEVS